MRPFRDIPIKAKMIAALMSTTLIALLVACIAFIANDRVAFRKELAGNLGILADVLARNSTAALSFTDLEDATSTLQSLRAKPSVNVACLYNAEDNVFATYSREKKTPIIPGKPDADGTHFADGQITVVKPITLNDSRLGTLYLRADLGELDDQLRAYVRISALVLLGTLTLTFVLAVALQRAITRPISTLTNTAKEVAHTRDYSTRAKQNGHDEIGTLTDSFNQMLQGIQERDSALQTANAALQSENAERQRAQEETRASHERFQIVVRATNDAVWDWNLVTNTRWWNEGYESLSGYAPEKTSPGPESWTLFIHPEDLERVVSGIYQAIDGGGHEWSGEYRFLRRDGTYADIYDRGHIIRDVSGKAIRMIGAMQDITQRKQAEAELSKLNTELEQRVAERTSELQTANASLTDFKAALDQHAIVAITDAHGKITYANDRFCAISKYAREELLGQDHRIVNSGYHPKAFIRELWATITSGRVWKGEIKNRAKDGSFYWVAATLIPFLGPHGKPSQYIAIRTDITERKQAEEALKLSEFSVQHASLATFWIAPNARILRVNPAVSDLLGYDESELLKLSIFDLDPHFPPDLWPAHWQELREAKRMCFETEQKHRDSHLISVEVQLNWFEFEGQEYNFAFVRDVTARKAAEQAIQNLNTSLRQQATQLETTNKELESFSYSVSHDLRAPLRAVDGFSRMVLKDYSSQLDADGQRMLGVIRSESQRMGRLIDDLLAFSRLGRQQLQTVQIDMRAMAQGVFDELSALDPERKLRFDLRPIPSAQGTEAMIRQVWVNLISNGIKFTKDRDPGVIEISVKAGENGEQIYYVKDNGAGFDMRYADKLFGVFQRLHQQSEFPGTGVGLALVQRIVQRHGGRVWADAEVGQGATFFFTIPNPTI